MTIELQTGLPGSGKTQYTLFRVEQIRRETGRPVYYSGIRINRDVLPDWQEIDPYKWFDAPPTSIIVIDEAQRVFRPRASGSAVPRWESELETHRHGGVDLVLITQSPRLVSVGVRELVGRHYHSVRVFGAPAARIHTWSECQLDIKRRANSESTITFPFRKEVYGWYHSAEAHTVKTRIPFRVIVLASLPFIIGGVVWYLNENYFSAPDTGAAFYPPGYQTMPPMGGRASGPVTAPGAVSPAQPASESWLRRFEPRVTGLPHTAPRYDKVTEPVSAPYPAACVSSASVCRCYTQQATVMDVPLELCRGIVRAGYFVDFDPGSIKSREDRETVSPAVSPAASDAVLPDVPLINLTPGITPTVSAPPPAADPVDTGQALARARRRSVP